MCLQRDIVPLHFFQALGDDCDKVRDIISKAEDWLMENEDGTEDVYVTQLGKLKQKILA